MRWGVIISLLKNPSNIGLSYRRALLKYGSFPIKIMRGHDNHTQKKTMRRHLTLSGKEPCLIWGKEPCLNRALLGKSPVLVRLLSKRDNERSWRWCRLVNDKQMPQIYIYIYIYMERPRPWKQPQLMHNASHCNTLQHTATHCDTLQHTATHCNTSCNCFVTWRFWC